MLSETLTQVRKLRGFLGSCFQGLGSTSSALLPLWV